MPTTRAEALRAGSPLYWPAKKCKHGHESAYLTVNYSCQECGRIKSLRSYYKNKTVRLAADAVRYRANREERRAYMRSYYKQARDAAIQRASVWAKANKELRRGSLARYREANRERLRAANVRRYIADRGAAFANAASRRARQRNAVPAWAERAAIRAVYREARRLTEVTGVKHSVDHYYPLAGEDVCGLHVVENLRIITLDENRRKGTRRPD